MTTGPETIEQAFAHHSDEMVRRARRVLGSESDAEDAVQEVLLTLLSAPHVLAPVRHLGRWLLTVVHRKAVDMVRAQVRRRRREESEGIAGLLAGADDPAALMERDEVARAVARAVKELPPPLRQAFVGQALEGKTFRTLSRESGVPEGTLMARKKKAVDSIRERLRREGYLG